MTEKRRFWQAGQSENFGVAPQGCKQDASVLPVHSVNQYPVEFDVRIPVMGPLSFQGMVFIVCGQRSVIHQIFQKDVELAKIFALSNCSCVIFFKPPAPDKVQYFLILHHGVKIFDV